ncbi:hypothetical protein AB0A76_26605 [Streptomyces exfoliatus]|uniref:Uncharacterized protein n=1 Tax=Streptomyces exfoliatus TaxID=1905 RepID=A0ABV3D2M6_STREX
MEVETAGTAVAVADNVRAPYAEANATVNSSGGIQNSKGVEQVTRLGTGEYCITFTDPRFDPSKVLPSVSSLQWGRSVSYGWSSGCDARDRGESSRILTALRVSDLGLQSVRSSRVRRRAGP